MITCPDCGFENPIISENCSCCGISLGFPNVNECSRQDEREALEKRYQEKVEFAKQNGKDGKRIKFEKAIKKSHAVINVNLDYLHQFFIGSNTLYSTYCLQTDGETRDFSHSEFDKERRGIESTLFGSYGKNIRYAALSIDGNGLNSYGDFTIILADKAIMKRATLLEDNSYQFIRNHRILAGDKIPPGYRAVWNDRHKLAVAKIKMKKVLTNNRNYANIILSSNGDRQTDEFIEVHIYGKINRESIDAVCGNSVLVDDDVKLMRIKEYLAKSQKEWIEEW